MASESNQMHSQDELAQYKRRFDELVRKSFYHTLDRQEAEEIQQLRRLLSDS